MISDYVNRTVTALGKRMMSGEIAASPYEMKGKTACQWCGYRSICGFDERLRGCGYRRMDKNMSEAEILEMMEETARTADAGGVGSEDGERKAGRDMELE